MDGEIIEIFVNEDGSVMLYPATMLVRDIAEEIGESEFDFTPYCG
jgi:hypothetical protein